MPNRLISVRFNEQEYLIHLYYNEEKINVILLDPPLREALHTDSFAINYMGQLIEEPSPINNPQIRELYSTIIQQNGEAINAFIQRNFN